MSNANVLTVQKYATAAQVREWAVVNGLEVATTRGRLPDEVVKAYNAKNGLKYRPGAAVETKEVEVRDGRGRKTKRQVNVGQARALLRANGVETGARGRLSLAQLAQAWELGSKPKSAQSPSEG